MKRNRNKYIVSVIFMFCILLGGMQHVSAQTLTSYGTWTSTTVSSQTVSLTDKVTIDGQIIIPAGVTLTINGKGKMIQRAGGDKPNIGHLFKIEPEGKLIINDAIIDGNNDWEGGGVETRPTSKGVRATGSFIYLKKVGDIELNNVTLQNGWLVTQDELDGKVWNNTDNTGVSLRSSGTGIYIGEGAAGDTYTDKVNFTMTNCKIQKLYSTYNGPIFINTTSAGSEVTITDCEFYNNMVWYPVGDVGTYNDGNQGGIIRTQGGTNADAVISGGRFENNITNGQAGAIYWNAGLGSLTVKGNVLFKGNKAGTYGGAMLVMTKVTLESATMTGNQAKYGGGLAYRPFNSGSAASPYVNENNVPFEQLTNANMELDNDITISGNTADYGGGIFIESGNIRFATMAGDVEEKDDNGELKDPAGFRDEPASMILSIKGAEISNNKAQDGGGIYMQSVQYGPSPVDEKTVSGLNFDSGTIQGNTATNNGGGVYLKGIPISFGGNETKIVENNKATGSGGGIYIDNTVKLLNQDLEVNLTKATISENEAGSQGGGIYVTGSEEVVAEVNLEEIEMTTNKATGNGGGLYLNGGNLNINGNGNTIQSNNAENGGGVCLEDGELVINQCDITDNSATNFGGGLYVANDTHVEIELTGNGVFENNTATVAGGGMAMHGPIKLTFSGSLQKNTAGNGGGIYLSNVNGASQKTLLDFTGGFIRDNVANGTGNSAETGYLQSVNSLNGFGGGAFLDSNTELTFEKLKGDLGFYGNVAESGADDIFANGDKTSVILPIVKDMKLNDFNVPTTELYWVEDYVPNDTRYKEYGSNMIAESGYPEDKVRRYRESLKQSEAIYKVTDEDFDEVKERYLCLALGYKILYLTIKKIGLQDGESAIFNVYNTKDNQLLATALLTGDKEKKDGVIQKVAVPGGANLEVVENTWTWNYNQTEVSPEGGKITVQETNSDEDNTITFTNTLKDNYKGKYDEAIKVNKMGGTSATAQ